MGQGKDIPGWAPFDFDGAARRVDLEGHAARLREKGLVDLQQDSGRVDRWVLSPDGLGWRFDFTKQLIDGAAWGGLRELAEAANWEEPGTPSSPVTRSTRLRAGPCCTWPCAAVRKTPLPWTVNP